MATEKQILANRENAKKSTGPRTSAGRAKSSRNALRHGASAHTPVIEGESLARFTQLLAEIKDLVKPRNIIESTIVENMAVAQWHQMRALALEKAAISSEMRRLALEDPEYATLEPVTRIAVAFRALSDNSRCLEVLGRQENRHFDQFEKALERLTDLRRPKQKK
jgi:hypothetical protein